MLNRKHEYDQVCQKKIEYFLGELKNLTLKIHQNKILII